MLAVQTIKNTLTKEKDPAKALMSYRATQLKNGYSPAEMLFERKIRTTVPVFSDQLKPSWPGLQELREHEQESKLVQTKRYNVSHRCTELPALKPGGHVWVVDQKKPEVVTEKATKSRSYVVLTQDGNPIRRNRRHLVSLPRTVQQELPQKEETTPSSLPSQQDGSPDNKTPTDAFETTRPGRVVRPPIRPIKRFLFFYRCDIRNRT